MLFPIKCVVSLFDQRFKSASLRLYYGQERLHAQ